MIHVVCRRSIVKTTYSSIDSSILSQQYELMKDQGSTLSPSTCAMKLRNEAQVEINVRTLHKFEYSHMNYTNPSPHLHNSLQSNQPAQEELVQELTSRYWISTNSNYRQTLAADEAAADQARQAAPQGRVAEGAVFGSSCLAHLNQPVKRTIL